MKEQQDCILFYTFQDFTDQCVDQQFPPQEFPQRRAPPCENNQNMMNNWRSVKAEKCEKYRKEMGKDKCEKCKKGKDVRNTTCTSPDSRPTSFLSRWSSYPPPVVYKSKYFLGCKICKYIILSLCQNCSNTAFTMMVSP